ALRRSRSRTDGAQERRRQLQERPGLQSPDARREALRRPVRDGRLHPGPAAGYQIQAGSERGARLRRHALREGRRLREVRTTRRFALRERRLQHGVTLPRAPPPAGDGMFVDEIDVFVKGGDGGAGCVSFRREKFVPYGGPDGGDGGHGGSIWLEADPARTTLLDYHYKRHYHAERGTHGKGSNCHGASGSDTILRVPLGTVVADRDTGEHLGDLTTAGQRVIAVRGAIGGRGNARFATSTNQAPRRADLGRPGPERWL